MPIAKQRNDSDLACLIGSKIASSCTYKRGVKGRLSSKYGLPCSPLLLPLLQGNVTYYCYNRQAGNTCPQATAADISNFRTSMTACFKKAIDLGLSTIAVAPHLDDGLGYGKPLCSSSQTCKGMVQSAETCLARLLYFHACCGDEVQAVSIQRAQHGMLYIDAWELVCEAQVGGGMGCCLIHR